MFVSKLPPKPDFDVLAAAAPASADRRTFVLALIGNLICSWSNNESLFIYVLMILLRTDEASAAVVFATLNTTRARLDLIQRLAKIRVSDKALVKNLTALIERFSESTKVRNELNHCMFVFDSLGRHHPHPVDAIDGDKVEPAVRRDQGAGRRPPAGDGADDQ